MFGECGLGSWTAELLQQVGKTDIGVINGGAFGFDDPPSPPSATTLAPHKAPTSEGLIIATRLTVHRGAIEAGNITLAQFTRSFPFPADLIVTMKLKGKHLLSMLEHSVSLANDTSLEISQGIGRFLQVRALALPSLPTAFTTPHAGFGRECVY
jgi:2',3'-cyclic-nucleotide 2'-phosphodiesterase (5'-nucleotidase family)